jgi:hypothetical protein
MNTKVIPILLFVAIMLACQSVWATDSGKAKASWRPCPNACLKLNQRGWCYQNMPGKPDYLIWLNFPYKEQSGGGECWSLDHLGEVIAYEGTRPVDKGECPTCHRTLYVGDPTKSFKVKKPIPLHPQTYKKENQVVLGLPFVKLLVRASGADVFNWYTQQLPACGWAIVDSTQVQSSSFMVITDGIKSKWMKVANNGGGNSEIIFMNRF